MISRLKYLVIIAAFVSCSSKKQAQTTATATNISTGNYDEPHRPQIHFSPQAHWMNDPNGMVYYNNTYHLFYQYYPDSTVWGPMHWGHATSKDLVQWEHQPIALYPDSLGYIFSGSAVADINNTSGFGHHGLVPLVAIFTHHDPKGEKAATSTFQNQSIAYSLDDGKTWTKYLANPVLKNPGIKDFRDPKVRWYDAGKKWIMTLATLDHITFYSSPNLKDWQEESKFGKAYGAHGGVWECPDLFPIKHNGKDVWVLLISINPGGPNRGSATQYFTGQFDGNTFTPYQTDTRWIDYGPDNYAGITWSNTGDRKIFLGWMSNWQYANVVPTEQWRSATTIPRDLGIEEVGGKYLVTSQPVPELSALNDAVVSLENIDASNVDLTAKMGQFALPARIQLTASQIDNFAFTFSNDAGEKVLVGFDKASNSYYLDRTNSGKVSFEKGFAARHTAPRLATKRNMDMTLVIDQSSIEMFADNGLSVMTQIFFPNSPFTKTTVQSPAHFKIDRLQFMPLKSIWGK